MAAIIPAAPELWNGVWLSNYQAEVLSGFVDVSTVKKRVYAFTFVSIV